MKYSDIADKLLDINGELVTRAIENQHGQFVLNEADFHHVCDMIDALRRDVWLISRRDIATTMKPFTVINGGDK